MGFPRDYLDFTTWYLVKKGYITRADNSDFTLTAEGVDYIETQRGNLPVLNKLLTDGKVQFADRARSSSEWQQRKRKRFNPRLFDSVWLDRRQSGGDRGEAQCAADAGIRSPGQWTRDRRMNSSDRRQNSSRSCVPTQ